MGRKGLEVGYGAKKKIRKKEWGGYGGKERMGRNGRKGRKAWEGKFGKKRIGV
jgi:hypothetical protein